MNRQGILHIVDSAYCFPVSENEIVIRLRTAKDDFKKASIIYESKYVFGEKQITCPMEKNFVDELYDYYVVKLTLEDTRLAYVFYLNDGEKNYYFSENGITEKYDFTLGFYNFFQYPYINKSDIMKKVDWCSTACFYQIFVDRFNMGNTTKDKSYINCNWGDIPTPKTFAGGDIKGITYKLDYIKNLGCNAIYLTPIFKSISNHKYDISDYYKIDEQFGSEEDLAELVENAHKKGIRVVMDAVFNHCSEETEQFKSVKEKGKASEFFDWYIVHGDEIAEDEDNYERFGPCKYMPKWNTSNPEVAEFLINIGKYYIEKFHIDGWRLDVADEVSHDFWRQFRKAIKECKEDALIIGENWHDAYSNLRGDQYDSIMNYSFTKACLDYFAKGDFNAKQMSDRLNEILMRNTDTVDDMMLNLLDSHDTHRFYSEVKEDDFRFEAAIALTYLFPGIPCIFYGTEIRTPGGFDPDCRRCMDWNKGDEKMISLLQKLSHIREMCSMSIQDARVYSVDNDLFVEYNSTEHKLIYRVNLVTKSYEVILDGGRMI